MISRTSSASNFCTMETHPELIQVIAFYFTWRSHNQSASHFIWNRRKLHWNMPRKKLYIMKEFTAAGKRKPLINVPFYPSSLTREEDTVLLFVYFDSAKVTLVNLKDQYFLMVKYCVVECLNRRIPSVE